MRTHRFPFVAGLLIALACGCGPPVPVSTGSLHYDWPREGSVLVTEQVDKKGKRAISSFDLQWQPLVGGGGYTFQYADMRLVEIAGRDATTPEMQEQLKLVQLLGSLAPSFSVSDEGEMLGFGSMDEMLDAMLEVIKSDGAINSAAARQIVNALREPSILETLEAKAGESWDAWVGHWTGLEFTRGGGDVWELDMDVTGGAIPRMDISYGERTHYRGVECVEITMRGLTDPELGLRKLYKSLNGLTLALDVKLPDDFAIARITRIDLVHGIYSAPDLRPLEVLRSTTTRTWEKGSDTPSIQREAHHNFFEWDDLEPAKKGFQAIDSAE